MGKCQCGHSKEDHAGHTRRGVCSKCYEQSDHGLNPYCSHYRKA